MSNESDYIIVDINDKHFRYCTTGHSSTSEFDKILPLRYEDCLRIGQSNEIYWRKLKIVKYSSEVRRLKLIKLNKITCSYE